VFWRKNIYPNTTGGLGVLLPSPRLIIGRPLGEAELNEVFHLESGRVVGNDWVVRHDNRYFQVKAPHGG
jgi:hypothetical protein